MIEKILNQLSIIEVGYGQATYKMGNGGVFNHKEKILWRDKIKIISKEIDGENIELKAMVKGLDFTISLKRENNKLIIYFDKKNSDINRLWFKLESTKSEKYYGCGENFTHFNLKLTN